MEVGGLCDFVLNKFGNYLLKPHMQTIIAIFL